MHIFVGFCWIGKPHMQHKMVAAVSCDPSIDIPPTVDAIIAKITADEKL